MVLAVRLYSGCLRNLWSWVSDSWLFSVGLGRVGPLSAREYKSYPFVRDLTAMYS